MLPRSFRELTQPVGERYPTIICFTKRARLVLSWLFREEGEQYRKDKRLFEMKSFGKLEEFFEFDKFQQLVEYVTDEGESDLRLRQVMAEYRQVTCRGQFMKTGFVRWSSSSLALEEMEKRSVVENFRFLSRQMAALLALIMLNNRTYQFDLLP